ncbi:MAG: site-specific integrase [Candidatus Marinimicrobia bacterium]|jgi:integrase/recombinase XerD|nr:site-specific integrase [Candidatus Neomarinimicrobiota bacterium]MBT7941036.1 site-specific integrase [Candidatus Neomarinimicrobiota bacterium]
MASIRKHKSKSKGNGFIVDYYDLDGIRKTKVLYTDRATADAFANRIEYRKFLVRSGLADDLKPNVVFSIALDNYIDYAAIQKKPNTIEREMYVYNRFREFVGDIKIRSISRELIECYIKKRFIDDKLSAATVDIEMRTMRQFFNVLIAHKFLLSNPMKGIQGPKVNDKPIRFLTAEEENKLLEFIDSDNFKDLIVAYLHSGARKEELLPHRFTWDSVDLKENTITITGKRDKVRMVPMTATLFKILDRRKNEMNEEFPFDFKYNNVLKKLQIYYDRAGIKDADVHTLRRTFGSRLVQKGVPIFTVSKLLGHSSVVITEKHYVSLLKSDLESQVRKLDELD